MENPLMHTPAATQKPSLPARLLPLALAALLAACGGGGGGAPAPQDQIGMTPPTGQSTPAIPGDKAGTDPGTNASGNTGSGSGSGSGSG
ncbi:MAG: hypothetical protein Q4E06_11720, partial [Lautropia sp.]|nr:hypothetical protein [Lautropia sp.]